MTYNPLAITRRNILGDLYNQCEHIDSIPVYMNDTSEEPIGTVDESLGQYNDAFVFQLPEAVCKRLSTSGYQIVIDYDYLDKNNKTNNGRIRLNHIVLMSKGVLTPLSKRNAASAPEKAQKKS
jgi:hypothetical protein